MFDSSVFYSLDYDFLPCDVNLSVDNVISAWVDFYPYYHGLVSDWTTRRPRRYLPLICFDKGKRRLFDIRQAVTVVNADTHAHYHDMDIDYAIRIVSEDFSRLRFVCESILQVSRNHEPSIVVSSE